MSRFSSAEDRRHIFQRAPAQPAAPTPEDGAWVDLYALLQVPLEATERDLDEAIIERGADVVYFTFSRSGKPAQIKELEKHLREMRPILLDAPVRRRYDQQLQLHRDDDPRAMRYDDFLKTLDLRQQSTGCLNTLLFLVATPLALLLLEKFSGRI